MIDAHITDARGVYLRTDAVDPMGSQPAGAIYGALPGAVTGKTRLWDGLAWRQVADADIPPVPTAPPLAAPQTCTPAQGLVALFVLKEITEDDLHAAIEAIPDPVTRYTARIGLSRATEWRRESPTMQQLAQLLELTEADLDALYSFAATVQV